MFLEKLDQQNIVQISWLGKMNEDPEIKEFLGKIDSTTYLENCFLLKEIEKSIYIGFITYSNPVDTIAGKTISIYYAIHPNYRYQGYGSVLLNLFIEEMLSSYSVDKLVLNIKKENHASQRLALKCGFQCTFEDDEDWIFLKDGTRKKTL